MYYFVCYYFLIKELIFVNCMISVFIEKGKFLFFRGEVQFKVFKCFIVDQLVDVIEVICYLVKISWNWIFYDGVYSDFYFDYLVCGWVDSCQFLGIVVYINK